MLELSILFPSVLNGLTSGAVYALIALGLTLIYGVLHIINFAHGALLMLALYGVYFLHQRLGLDPYASLPVMVPAMFVLGYGLQRFVIGRASHGKDENIILVTLGLAIVIENLALYLWRSDTRTIETAYTFSTVDILGAMISVPKVAAFAGALAVGTMLLALLAKTDLGRAIRAIAKERQGAKLVGIDVEHVYAMSFGIGLACLGAAACFLLPAYYVSPQVGNGFVLIAFTIVVLGGMGSFAGALAGGFIIGVVESVGGLWLGESLGQIGIFLIFIAVLLFRPQGLFRRADVKELVALFAFGIAVAALPLFVSSGFALNIVIMTLYAALLGQAWNILGGFAGQFSFGHAVFFGTGAYAAAVLQVKFGWNAWVALPAAVALGAAVGAFVGALSFRYGLRGSYFALVTLAFAEVFRILSNTFEFTGAGVGLMIPLAESAANFQFTSRTGFLYVILGFTLAACAVTWWLKHSRYGAWLQAVRDNEESAAALGVNVFRVKLGAIMISGALMSAGGVFYVQYFHYIDPHIAYGPGISIEALLAPIVGGIGTLFGPLLGAAALQLFGELTRNLMGDAPGISLMVYGLLLVLMVTLLPRGIMGLVSGPSSMGPRPGGTRA